MNVLDPTERPEGEYNALSPATSAEWFSDWLSEKLSSEPRRMVRLTKVGMAVAAKPPVFDLCRTRNALVRLYVARQR